MKRCESSDIVIGIFPKKNKILKNKKYDFFQFFLRKLENFEKKNICTGIIR